MALLQRLRQAPLLESHRLHAAIQRQRGGHAAGIAAKDAEINQPAPPRTRGARPGTARETAAHQRLALHPGTGRTQGLQPVAHAEGHAFQHAVRQRGGIVVVVQAEEHAAGIGVVVRGAFAGKVGQEQRRTGGPAGVTAFFLHLRQQRGLVLGAHQARGQRRQEAADSITLIWCQRAGEAWQNACTAEAGLGWKRSVTTNNTPLAQRQEAIAGPHGTDARGAGGVVTAAGRC